MSVNWICTCVDGNTKFRFTDGRSYAICCSKIFHDKMSGAKRQRPGLEEALQYAREGDIIVVWRLDRLGRNMQDLIQIVNSLNERVWDSTVYKKI